MNASSSSHTPRLEASINRGVEYCHGGHEVSIQTSGSRSGSEHYIVLVPRLEVKFCASSGTRTAHGNEIGGGTRGAMHCLIILNLYFP